MPRGSKDLHSCRYSELNCTHPWASWSYITPALRRKIALETYKCPFQCETFCSSMGFAISGQHHCTWERAFHSHPTDCQAQGRKDFEKRQPKSRKNSSEKEWVPLGKTQDMTTSQEKPQWKGWLRIGEWFPDLHSKILDMKRNYCLQSALCIQHQLNWFTFIVRVCLLLCQSSLNGPCYWKNCQQ